MPNPFDPFLERSGVVILDGALATELERRGADLRDPLWSARVLLEQPDLIRQVHYDYFAAGADVAITASYQATFPGLARRGLSEKDAAKLMVRSVRLAQEARDDFWSDPERRGDRCFPLVAASIGCFGAFLHDGSEYRGDYGLSVHELIDFHRPRLDVLAGSGADLLACETIPCLTEAEALVRLLQRHAERPAWLSFSCRDGRHVRHGEPLTECVALTASADNIVAVGVNCTPPEFVGDLLDSIAKRTRKLLLAYPNSGESWNAQSRSWQQGTAGVLDWGTEARRWYEAGARLIGGCCRTTPETIRQIAGALRG